MPFSDKLFSLFDDENVSWDAARAIGQISAADKILTKRNHAILRVGFRLSSSDILRNG